MKPSLSPPAPTIRKTVAPARVMPKEQGKPAPAPVAAGSAAKQAVKPAAIPVKASPSSPHPIAMQERPAAKKAESSAPRLPVERKAVAPKPVATERAVNGKPAQHNGGAQSPLPVKLKPLPKFAFLKVRTIPKGATIYVNGIQKGRSPLTLKLDLGRYRVKLCREGYRDTECLVNLDRMTEYPLVEKLKQIE
jgi:hypothetical protein